MPERTTDKMPPNLASLGAGLFTDLYELTMSQAYDAEGFDQQAVFEMYFRELRPSRNYLVAAGLADVLEYIENLHFDEDDLEYLRSQELFSESFLKRLRRLRFSGDVYAVPEGTVVFANEPVLTVVAPILEAQLLETLILNQVHFQTVIATKAARTVLAARGRSVVDFGSRRAHGTDAAMKVARVSYMAGAAGTSNVLAGRVYDMPIFGTMAHSYIQAHDDERVAFEAFARQYPETTLLVDTYDTIDGVRNVIRLAGKLKDQFRIRAIRLDSGDLGALAVKARAMLDDAGLSTVKIFASSGLDEYAVDRLLASGAPIDAFGVGTRLAVSRDAPDLDCAYKLVAYAGRPRIKRSPGKVLHGGQKQVFRRYRDGTPAGDIIGHHDERAEGEPLLTAVMKGGVRTDAGRTTLSAAREHAKKQLASLPQALKSLEPASPAYPVRYSSSILEDDRGVSRHTGDSDASHSR